ncbi:unnamed protein product [Paramecium pentaurelia]|uniref:Uncharacterized protein n=1 Tax=Paramecium pentaurelia TaxID=43138 RepID=A0A8S1WF80_9CILI|nr:unnamed protein product [Paramecium pentaurelia]
MLQQDPKPDQNLKILLKSEFKLEIPIQPRWVERIVPLKYNLIFLYFEGGSYLQYNIEKNKFMVEGRISDKIKFFHEVYTEVLVYHDTQDLSLKLLDLRENIVNPNFSVRSSDKIDIKSDESSREMIIDKYRVFFLDCEEKGIKYMITQDLEKYYSNNNVCHYTIRVLPLEYDPQTKFDLQPIAKYDYPNSLGQTELYFWLVDKETIAVFGQDTDHNKSEILLIKPHLAEKAFYIVHTQFACSYTILNVSNWVNPHQVAIWVNCNDGTTKPSIFTFDLRNYYDGINWLPEPEFTSTLARDEYINDEPTVFMDIYQFNLDSTYAIQIRQVGNEAKISIINYENVQKPEIINEVAVDQFWIVPSADHSYILLYNDMAIQDRIVKFQILFPADARHQLLQIIEKAKVIEKYGINNVEEIFEFYQ